VLLTIDIGTSSFKSALWDFDGNILSHAVIPLSINTSGNLCEADCSQWLRAFETCCQRLGSLAAVRAVVLSGNGPTLVPVTGEPELKSDSLSIPAQPARLWLDRRAVKYQAEVTEALGGFVDAGFFLPKILNIKNDESELYRRVKFFLGCPEYLAYALCGEARTVIPSDGFDRWFWNDAVLEKLNLDAAKFPVFIRPGDPFGIMLPSVVSHFGFANNIPVISGGPDFFASILGAGVTKPGQACDRTGSSEGVNLCTQTRVNDTRLMSYGHPVKPYWNLSGIISTTGKAIEWCRDLLGFSGFDDFFTSAQRSEHGSGGLVFLPYLAGERAPLWDPSARGLWRGISLDTGRNEFANSVLEGICFAVRDVISVMEETSVPVNELRVTGGLAGRSRLNQIKADITGKRILEPVCKEAELLGLAIIGACSLGHYSTYEEAASVLVRIEKQYEPQPEKTALYDRLFAEYRRSRSG
jgi:xylulokinase